MLLMTIALCLSIIFTKVNSVNALAADQANISIICTSIIWLVVCLCCGIYLYVIYNKTTSVVNSNQQRTFRITLDPALENGASFQSQQVTVDSSIPDQAYGNSYANAIYVNANTNNNSNNNSNNDMTLDIETAIAIVNITAAVPIGIIDFEPSAPPMHDVSPNYTI